MYIQQCISCGDQFDQDHLLYTCPKCGDLKGTLDIIYDYENIKIEQLKKNLTTSKIQSIFRYSFLLPLSLKNQELNLNIGLTPLTVQSGLAAELNVSKIYFKDDSFNPTLSFKDRASAISLLKAKEFNYRTVTTASTGNAAASMACIGANLGLETVIFVPESIPKAKLMQLQIYGAQIILVKDNYDVAFDLCRQVSKEKNWYNRSTAINPFNLEGKKTVAFEICEQLDFEVPDLIFIPVGDGCIISGVWKGFNDFYKIGLIDRLPKLIACQAQGSASVYNAFHNGWQEPKPVKSDTIADSISVNLPRDGCKALRALRDSSGDAIKLSDERILYAQGILAREHGYFCEPSAACAFAGLLDYHENAKLNPDNRLVVLLTGSGMKDPGSAKKIITDSKTMVFDPQKDKIDRLLEI